MTKLNNLEATVLKATLNFCNYGTPEAEKDDNAVIFSADDLA